MIIIKTITHNNEIWKPIVDFEHLYEISNNARIRNIETGKILKPYINDNGYYTIRLKTKSGTFKHKKLHRLLMLTFVGEDAERPIVNHKNGDKLDLDLNNLEWCTSSENNKHAFDMGLKFSATQKKCFITLGDLHFSAPHAEVAAKRLHEEGYFTDVSIDSLKTALRNCANNHRLYNGIVKVEFADDRYDIPNEYHRCGIKGREICAELECGLIVKCKGPSKLADTMNKLGYWKQYDRNKLIKQISGSALGNYKCHGIKVWYK